MAGGPLSGSRAVHRVLPCALEMWCLWPGFCCQNTWCSHCVFPARALEKLAWLSCPFVSSSRTTKCQQSVWGSCGFHRDLGDLEVGQETWRSMLLPFISSCEMCFNYTEVINCSSQIVETVSEEHGDILRHDFTDAAFCLQSWALHVVCTLGML